MLIDIFRLRAGGIGKKCIFNTRTGLGRQFRFRTRTQATGHIIQHVKRTMFFFF
jgi:hypothetical protein